MQLCYLALAGNELLPEKENFCAQIDEEIRRLARLGYLVSSRLTRCLVGYVGVLAIERDKTPARLPLGGYRAAIGALAERVLADTEDARRLGHADVLHLASRLRDIP